MSRSGRPRPSGQQPRPLAPRHGSSHDAHGRPIHARGRPRGVACGWPGVWRAASAGRHESTRILPVCRAQGARRATLSHVGTQPSPDLAATAVRAAASAARAKPLAVRVTPAVGGDVGRAVSAGRHESTLAVQVSGAQGGLGRRLSHVGAQACPGLVSQGRPGSSRGRPPGAACGRPGCPAGGRVWADMSRRGFSGVPCSGWPRARVESCRCAGVSRPGQPGPSGQQPAVSRAKPAVARAWPARGSASHACGGQSRLAGGECGRHDSTRVLRGCRAQGGRRATLSHVGARLPARGRVRSAGPFGGRRVRADMSRRWPFRSAVLRVRVEPR